MELVLQFANIIFFLVLLTGGYIIGSFVEKRHYKSIYQREKETLKMQVMTAEPKLPEERIKKVFLVSGNAVISIDYFKRLLAQLRNIFGGRVKSYESLVDRARREAILRMKEQARAQGARAVVNFRLETSTIGRSANNKKTVGSVEAIAYGTAIVLQPK